MEFDILSLGSTKEANEVRQYLTKWQNTSPPSLTMDFDPFPMTATQLYAVALYILNDLDLLSVLKIPTAQFLEFIIDVKEAYMDNPYHCFRHAMDVYCQTYYMMTDLQAGLHMTQVDQLSLLLGALCHDTGHPGKNNLYQMNANTDLARLYGDVSTLEKHSCSIASELLEKYSLLRNVVDSAHARSFLIESILATDMVYHGSIIHDFTTMFSMSSEADSKNMTPSETIDDNLGKLDISLSGISENSDLPMPERSAASSPDTTTEYSIPQRQLVGKILLHAADISNACRPWQLCKRWSDPVIEEFFNQGDSEKHLGLTISPNMDREQTTQHKIALGFGDFIVKNLYEVMATVWPHFQVYLDNLESNKLKWQKLKEDTTLDPESLTKMHTPTNAPPPSPLPPTYALGRRMSTLPGVIQTGIDNHPVLQRVPLRQSSADIHRTASHFSRKYSVSSVGSVTSVSGLRSGSTISSAASLASIKAQPPPITKDEYKNELENVLGYYQKEGSTLTMSSNASNHSIAMFRGGRRSSTNTLPRWPPENKNPSNLRRSSLAPAEESVLSRQPSNASAMKDVATKVKQNK